jgi:hypothetical protein
MWRAVDGALGMEPESGQWNSDIGATSSRAFKNGEIICHFVNAILIFYFEIYVFCQRLRHSETYTYYDAQMQTIAIWI